MPDNETKQVSSEAQLPEVMYLQDAVPDEDDLTQTWFVNVLKL